MIRTVKYHHRFGEIADALEKRTEIQNWDVSREGRKSKFYIIWIRKILTKDGRTDEYKFLVDKEISKRYSVYVYTHMYEL